MFKFKKYFALLMATIMMLSYSISSFAANNNSIIVDGVKFTFEETINSDGNKTVKVTGNGEINTVTNNGTYLYVNTESIKARSSRNYVIEIDHDNQPTLTTRAGTKKTSLWWDYYYYEIANSTYGMYWSLRSGRDTGSWSGFDKNNSTARDFAYDFCTSVRSLDSAQWAASAASGASGGSIATAGPTAGIGAIIGIVAAPLSGGVAVAEWIAAYNYSLDCNQIFTRFKQSL